jgi:hypothetical protein
MATVHIEDLAGAVRSGTDLDRLLRIGVEVQHVFEAHESP